MDGHQNNELLWRWITIHGHGVRGFAWLGNGWGGRNGSAGWQVRCAKGEVAGEFFYAAAGMDLDWMDRNAWMNGLCSAISRVFLLS